MQTEELGIARIVWGVEALADDRELQERTAHVLKAIVRRAKARVEPVYVLSPDQLRLPLEIYSLDEPRYSFETFSEHSREVARAIEGRLEQWLTQLEFPELLPERLLVQEEYSLRASVHALVSFAEAEGADWIAVSTHARAGLSRFLLGSFAETLVHQSRLPVLVVGPEADLSEFREILAPVDFTPASRAAFEKATTLACRLGVELTLFHKISFLTHYTSTFYQDAKDLSIHMRYTELKKREAQSWAEWARAKGARVSVAIDQRESGDVTESILERAKQEPGALLLMASQTGPVASTILGSVTRQVVRHARCPVLVVHPPKENAAA